MESSSTEDLNVENQVNVGTTARSRAMKKNKETKSEAVKPFNAVSFINNE